MALFSAERARVNSGGEAGGRARQKVRCEMGSNLSGDISEVKFLTIAEVASVMRVSKMTVYRLVHSGELPAVRVGRSFRVSEEDVNEYLRKSFFQTG
jgi:excisionase family DNA binding protein